MSNSVLVNNLATSKVSSPGTIALTTGIPTLGIVKSTIITLLNPPFLSRFKISFISSSMSFLTYDLTSENDIVLLFFLLLLRWEYVGINSHFLLYISSFTL